MPLEQELAQDIQRLVKSIDSMTSSHEAFRSELKHSVCRQEYLVTRVAGLEQAQLSVKEDTLTLVKLVRDGNGQPPLLDRVARIEQEQIGQNREIVILHADVGKLETAYDARITAIVLSKGQIVAGIIGMVITALLAAASMVVSLTK